MPYADPERQRQAQRESDRRHAAEIAERKKKRYWEHVDVTRANENERNWRMGMHAKMTRETAEFIHSLTVVNSLELTDPRFVFIYQGQRKYENLREPLPV